ncbi:hypothetical protein HNQ02_003495 [Flavobacterium sp. 7E]|nr:hypothetical protein [Flavobacterium sp. 7E]NRS90550.1 hypothetical protein [Flavobacterium sp. 7E]
MESRLIYESSKTHLYKIKWTKIKDTESEWKFLGTENSVNEKKLVPF